MRTARYRFRDASFSESVTSVRLSLNASDAAFLGLAYLLDQASDASLISVDDLLRVRIRETPSGLLPSRVRLAMYPNNPLFDAYHALIPVNSETALNAIIEELTNQPGWTTRSGYSLEGATPVYYASAIPNWRDYNPPYFPEDKQVLVLHGRLWRDLLVTSMALYSETMRDPLTASDAPNGYARYQLVDLLRVVPLNELLQRLDQIIALLQQIRNGQQVQGQDIEDVEAILRLVLETLRG